MKIIKDIITIILFVIAVIALIIVIDIKCNPEPPDVIIETKTDTFVKVVFRDFVELDTIIKYKPKIIKDSVFIFDTVYLASEIISDYFAEVVYKDTILNDSTGFISILDTITLNRLKNRTTSIKLYNTTKIIQDNKLHFYIGAGTGINQNQINISINGYLTKNKHLFGVGYNNNKQVLINYNYRIK